MVSRRGFLQALIETRPQITPIYSVQSA